MIAAGLTLMTLSGPVAFWICGLLLCLFIGPTQSSARTLMLRMAADGKEGVAFGLYTTTGRAVSFLAPSLISLFIDLFGTVRAGIGGFLVVLAMAWRPWWRCTHRTGYRRATATRCRSSARGRCCSTWTPAIVTEQVTSRPTLMIVRLAELRCRAGQLHFFAPRQETLNSAAARRRCRRR